MLLILLSCWISLNIDQDSYVELWARWYCLLSKLVSLRPKMVRRVQRAFKIGMHNTHTHTHILFRVIQFVPMGAHLVYIGHPCIPDGHPWAHNVWLWFSWMQNASMRWCEWSWKGSTSSLHGQRIRLNERCVYIFAFFFWRQTDIPATQPSPWIISMQHDDMKTRKGKASFMSLSWVSNVGVVYPYLDTGQREPRRGTWASKDWDVAFLAHDLQ